jgi:N-acetylmuramoyl-L-alanine amidase
MKRKIDYIVIHCTGASQKQTVDSILRHWREVMGWKKVGYHRLISADGTIHNLADFNQVTNGVRGYNQNSIHICYIGGQHLDNRTEAQKASILNCIHEALKWVDDPKKVVIQGHRDFDGVGKNCPQFSAKDEYLWITA